MPKIFKFRMLLTTLQFYMTILLLFMILHILYLHPWNSYVHNLTNYPSVVKWLLWKSGLLIFDRLRDIDLEKSHWKGVFIVKKIRVRGIKTRAAAQALLRNPTPWEAAMLTVERWTSKFGEAFIIPPNPATSLLLFRSMVQRWWVTSNLESLWRGNHRMFYHMWGLESRTEGRNPRASSELRCLGRIAVFLRIAFATYV